MGDPALARWFSPRPFRYHAATHGKAIPTRASICSPTGINCYRLIFILLTPLRLNSCSSNSKTNLPKYTTLHSARNLGFIFDEHLTFADQITALSKACYYHIRQLRCIRPYLDSSTACTIATSIVHSKLDYCNSLYYKLPKSQLSRLQQI